MQLRDIEYVLGIAEAGSFSGAAKLLYISQPALSKSILRLEDELGVKLFVRHNNKTSLTRAGELFVEDANQVRLLSAQIKKKMEDIQHNNDGRITFGISQYNGQIYFSKILLEFKKHYPNIKLNVVEDFSSNLERGLLTGNLDFALLTLPISSDELKHEHLFYEEMLLAVPPSHAVNKTIRTEPGRFGSIKLSYFKDDDFILMKPKHRLRVIENSFFKKAGFEPNVVFESRSSDTIQSFVTGGIGIGFVSAAMQRKTPAEWQSVYYHLEDVDAKREHVIAYKKNGYVSHATRAFINLAKELCEKQFNYQDDLVIRQSL